MLGVNYLVCLLWLGNLLVLVWVLCILCWLCCVVCCLLCCVCVYLGCSVGVVLCFLLCNWYDVLFEVVGFGFMLDLLILCFVLFVMFVFMTLFVNSVRLLCGDMFVCCWIACVAG